MFKVPEKNRIKSGRLGSTRAAGNRGAFEIVSAVNKNRTIFCIASDGLGWEHVSAHVVSGSKMYTPYWEEMCQVKAAFWDETDLVIQYHPTKDQYVNLHPNVLHLWRQPGTEIPTPPKILV